MKEVFCMQGYIYICDCETYPLIWMWWWFKFRVIDTYDIIDTALDYILQTWGIISATPSNQCLIGLSKRIRSRIRKNIN